MNIITKKSINTFLSSRKKIIVMFVVVVTVLISTIFVLYEDGLFSSKKVDQKQIDYRRSEVQKSHEEIVKKNDQKRKNDLNEIEIALEKYYDENNSYPINKSGIKLNDENSEIYNILKKYVSDEKRQDPNNPEYYYEYKSDGSSFELSARLENLDDEKCEMINENICIYRIKTFGKIAKKYIVDEKKSDFLEKIVSFEMDKPMMIVTENYVDENSQKIIDMLNPPKNVKIRKIKELSDDDRKTKNLILIGNPDLNAMIFEVYKKGLVIENLNIYDENNEYIATLNSAQSVWNKEKNIYIIETGCTAEKIIKVTSQVEVEKNGENLFRILLSTNNDKYVLTPDSNFDNKKSFIKIFSESSDREKEIYGYKKVCDFEKIVLADEILVMNVNVF